MPGSLFFRYSPDPGRSVSFCCVTRYCWGESLAIASALFLYIFMSSANSPRREMVTNLHFSRRPTGIAAHNDAGPSVFPIVTLHRIKQFLGVVSGTVLEDNLDIFDIRYSSRRIALYHDAVPVLPRRDRADLILAAEKDGAVQRGNLNRLDRCEPGLHQQFDFALIAKPWN